MEVPTVVTAPLATLIALTRPAPDASLPMYAIPKKPDVLDREVIGEPEESSVPPAAPGDNVSVCSTASAISPLSVTLSEVLYAAKAEPEVYAEVGQASVVPGSTTAATVGLAGSSGATSAPSDPYELGVDTPMLRYDLQAAAFKHFDLDGDGHLRSLELRRFWGFHGSDAEWADAYELLCWALHVDPRKGLDLMTYCNFMDESDDASVFGSHGSDIAQMLSETAPDGKTNELDDDPWCPEVTSGSHMLSVPWPEQRCRSGSIMLSVPWPEQRCSHCGALLTQQQQMMQQPQMMMQEPQMMQQYEHSGYGFWV